MVYLILMISLDIHGYEAGIVKCQWNLKVLGAVAGQRRDSLQDARTAWPGSNIVENVRFGRLWAVPRSFRAIIIL